jgi:hypothetical protein
MWISLASRNADRGRCDEARDDERIGAERIGRLPLDQALAGEIPKDLRRGARTQRFDCEHFPRIHPAGGEPARSQSCRKDLGGPDFALAHHHVERALAAVAQYPGSAQDIVEIFAVALDPLDQWCGTFGWEERLYDLHEPRLERCNDLSIFGLAPGCLLDRAGKGVGDATHRGDDDRAWRLGAGDDADDAFEIFCSAEARSSKLVDYHASDQQLPTVMLGIEPVRARV